VPRVSWLWGIMVIAAAMTVSEARAAAGGANCDGALMVAEIAAAVERGAKPPADESFQQLMGSARFIAAAEAGDAVAEYSSLADWATRRGRWNGQDERPSTGTRGPRPIWD
jgi:hypothetical protein